MERKPVKSLVDLKMTHWYLSRNTIIQEAINKYPPGYYIFSGNGEVYKLIGWSEPEEKKGETEVYIYLEREITEGAERLRIHPKFILPETELIETIQQVEETISHPLSSPMFMGYNVGKEVNGEVKFLMDAETNQRRLFDNTEEAKEFLIDSAMASLNQLDDFVYSPVWY